MAEQIKITRCNNHFSFCRQTFFLRIIHIRNPFYILHKKQCGTNRLPTVLFSIPETCIIAAILITSLIRTRIVFPVNSVPVCMAMPTIGHHFKDSGIHFSLHSIPIYRESIIKFAISIPQESTSISRFSEDCILRYRYPRSFF